MVSWGRPSYFLHLLIDSLLFHCLQPMFTGRTDAEAEAPILWPPDVKSQFIGKDSDARKDWGQEDKGVTEDEMVGWYHQLNGHEFAQTQGDGEGQGRLVCCSPWGWKELDRTESLNNNNLQPNHEKVLFVLKPWLRVISLSLLFLIWVYGPPFKMQKLF